MKAADQKHKQGERAIVVQAQDVIMTLQDEEEESCDVTGKNDDLSSIRSQCAAMAKTLTRLQEEEAMLKMQNDLLAREAVEAGYTMVDSKTIMVQAKKIKTKEKNKTTAK
uniref:Uncharacterized protein n=1 Tax=Leptocylindrus danicus TaxID=163516 RepID=A0A7S2NXR1_9STRA|mmetsp:Transcript_17661/g.26301  ORF Transcript_17661/g.26301 Transcript_17661/m.26301 type:complete len:110 (+) Transcript_17661:73-402(+)